MATSKPMQDKLIQMMKESKGSTIEHTQDGKMILRITYANSHGEEALLKLQTLEDASMSWDKDNNRYIIEVHE